MSNDDLMMVIFSSSLLILALVTSRGNTVLRAHGFVFVLFYVTYIGYVVQR